MPSHPEPDRAAAPRTICLVRLSALGDVVMVAPLIKMLRREWPAARITWVIGKAAHPAVASLARLGVEFVVIDKPRGARDYLALRRRLAGRHFDALLCLQASWRANLVYPCIRARRKIGYGRDRAKDCHAWFVRETLPAAAAGTAHILDGFLQFGEALGGARAAEDYEGAWGLEPPPEARAWADGALPAGPWLAVAPCASKAERDWPASGWAAVAAHAWRAHRLPAVLLGGPAARDAATAAEIRALLPPDCPVTDLTGRTDVPRLLAALERCALLLAPDTGATHIARAFGRPVVGLYAVAPSSRTGPYRRTEYCVDKFVEAVALVHGAGSAKARRGARVHDPRAMGLIGTEEVSAALDAAAAAAAASSAVQFKSA
ncbi:MAG: glycosyltransferase family 9 protein [Opitutaceae bacterium]|nr:glycosyltransferase family 9 protein [Opitutaceae bacterium]